MRKIASILLLAILCFNWIGYQFFTNYIQEKENSRFTAALDDNRFDESQLISLKVPATYISGYVHTTPFERIDGRLELNGVQYNYVQRRIVNDSVEYRCVPNERATQLASAKTEFFKLVNDIQHPGQGKKSGQHNGKSFSPDMIVTHTDPSVATASVFVKTIARKYLFVIPSSARSFEGQPPEVSIA